MITFLNLAPGVFSVNGGCDAAAVYSPRCCRYRVKMARGHPEKLGTGRLIDFPQRAHRRFHVLLALEVGETVSGEQKSEFNELRRLTTLGNEARWIR